MWKVAFKSSLYVSFVCVLYLMSYSNHNAGEYQQVQHLRRLFLKPHNATVNYLKVRTTARLS